MDSIKSIPTNIYNKFFTDSKSNYQETTKSWYEPPEHLSSEHFIYGAFTSYLLTVSINLHNQLMASDLYRPLKALGCLTLAVITVPTYLILKVEATARIAISLLAFQASTLFIGDLSYLNWMGKVFVSAQINFYNTPFTAISTAFNMLTKNEPLALGPDSIMTPSALTEVEANPPPKKGLLYNSLRLLILILFV